MKSNISCTDTTKKVATYRKAARLLERRKELFACHAIRAAGGEHLCAHLKEWYCDGPSTYGIAWLSGIGTDEQDTDYCDFRSIREVNGRILALCFMAAMVEAGDA